MQWNPYCDKKCQRPYIYANDWKCKKGYDGNCPEWTKKQWENCVACPTGLKRKNQDPNNYECI